MNDQNTQNVETPTEATDGPANAPDWIVKASRGQYKNSYLERIGAAWSRDDGGIGVRLHGRQIIEGDIYLYPNEPVAN